jgi:SagB-type dehydrogenase family enzyme
MIPFEDTSTLSQLYHLNSEPWLNVSAYSSAEYEVDYKESPDAREVIALPVPEESPLLKVLKARSSCREYLEERMPVATLASLLTAAYGVVRITKIQDELNALFRTTPSAGGLFPLEIYSITQRVVGLPDGVYHYAVRSHRLELMKTGSLFSETYGPLLVDPFVQDANVVFFISAVFSRTQRKYGPRGYRYILFEAGHVAQNICLMATEQGLGSLCMGGFLDSKLNRFLGLDGVNEAVLYGVGVGYARRRP